jgi:hypothetical protein
MNGQSRCVLGMGLQQGRQIWRWKGQTDLT